MHVEGLQLQNSARTARCMDYASRQVSKMCNTAHCIASSTGATARDLRCSHPRPPRSLEGVRMPTGVHPVPIPPHKNLRRPPRTHRSFTIFFRLHHIGSPDNGHVAEALYLRAREFQPQQFSAACLKLRRRPQHIRLVLPLCLIRADHNRVGRHQPLQRLRVVRKPRSPHALPHFENLPALILAERRSLPQQQSQHKNSDCHPHNPPHIFLLSNLPACPTTPPHKTKFRKRTVHRATKDARPCAHPALQRAAFADPVWYSPGTVREEITSRFQALIVAAAKVRSHSSFSLNCARASSYTASGA